MDRSERYCYEPELRWDPKVEEYFVKAYGAEHFARISKALTSTSDEIAKKLSALQERQWKPDNSEGVDSCPVSDDASVAPLDPTTTATPQNFAISKCDIPNLDYVLFLQGSGPHLIDYGFKDDKPLKEVLVSRKCAEAVLRGAQVYVPGVLACSAHVEKGEAVAVSVAVEQPIGDGNWSVGFTRGTTLQGSETDLYHSERSGLYIGQGTAILSRAGMFRVSHGVAVDMFNRVFKLPSFHTQGEERARVWQYSFRVGAQGLSSLAVTDHTRLKVLLQISDTFLKCVKEESKKSNLDQPDLLEGEIFLQNLPSIIAAHALDPQEGEKILDMCAAPGGKTTAIAILMKDKGEVIAADRSHNKVLGIQKLAAEMGLKCITTCKLDALKSVRIVDKSESNDASQAGENESIQRSGSLISKAEKISDTGLGVKDGKVASLEQSNEHSNCKSEATMDNRRTKNGRGRSHCLGEKAEKSKGFLPNSFDRVLLDAPCSALGLRPRLFTSQENVESLRAHATYQRRMFDQAVQLVRPGGVIVYSTCTINPGENESLVRYALDRYKFLSLASQHPRVGGPGLVGSCQLSDGYTDEWLRPGEENLVQRFDPSSLLDTIGFFIAKFSVGHKDI